MNGRYQTFSPRISCNLVMAEQQHQPSGLVRGHEICLQCKQSVRSARDRVMFAGYYFHRQCLRCQDCKMPLKPHLARKLSTDCNQFSVYCNLHYELRTSPDLNQNNDIPQCFNSIRVANRPVTTSLCRNNSTWSRGNGQVTLRSICSLNQEKAPMQAGVNRIFMKPISLFPERVSSTDYG
ncbi:hypothetical protein Ciccas_003845 [Cichlidogyrus casuarinus]|uniref:LIM zinc-binding domain-containing protein n=1 Tax=Cichlidogyrus casuarinus TaxID=1844966 RepID=A0ABD2QGJ6_9PLAT